VTTHLPERVESSMSIQGFFSVGTIPTMIVDETQDTRQSNGASQASLTGRILSFRGSIAVSTIISREYAEFKHFGSFEVNPVKARYQCRPSLRPANIFKLK